ncbi:MAG: lysine biosynthesis protein LysW [Phycisphaeraceae bacterium]|nr:MAG: lysine biosynthesis protein LysW [Phycisphaeraceae bacterium]
MSTALNTSCDCPECGGAVGLKNAPLRGEVVRCGDCSTELEITSTSPLTLSLAPQVQEDWGE